MSDLVLRPTWRFVLSRPAYLVAFGFGAGLAPVAPGTFGTLLAFPLYWLFFPEVGALEFLLLIVVLFVLGVWACEMTGRALGVSDHGGMVWDETVAFLLVLFFVPGTPYWQAAAFLLFRLFDILKPPPIRYYDRTIKSGFGVMLDDLIAAFYTLLVLAAAKTLLD
ncbi:MAG TPA: phosphatidylglycerophosphatase A [Burkholderiales bacterium]|nr:phosphatidylglycerophosphatase A [Burkholderiales bacterium]